jgi:hypothetical protein
LCARLRPRAVALMDLLDVEIEMLTNPLVAHYQDWLRAYSRCPTPISSQIPTTRSTSSNHLRSNAGAT